MRHAPILPTLLLLLAAPGAPGALAAAAEPPREVQSSEDRGFAIVLTSPTEPWLNGRQTIRIETIIPRDDTVEQVDFFVDRRLVFVDNDEPYSHTVDFGDEIRRHTIEVKALTREGRRARVSLVSRSLDPSESAQGRLVTLTAVARDAAGRPVDRLNVSDFTVTEGETPQSIVHFRPGPSPASVAVVVEPQAWIPAREPVRRFLTALPPHQAVALLGPPGFQPPPGSTVATETPAAGSVAAPAAGHAAKPEPDGSPKTDPDSRAKAPAAAPAGPSPFTYDIRALAASLPRPPEPVETAAATGDPAGDAQPAVQRRNTARPAPPRDELPGTLSLAAAALRARRGPRLLVVVAAAAPFGDEPFGPPRPPAPEAKAPKPAHPETGGANKPPEPVPDPLAAALEEARRTGAPLFVIALPAEPERTWSEARAAERMLQAAAETSGGRYLRADDPAAMERALNTVTETLRHQYVVTYVTDAPAQSGWKPLKVTTGERLLTLEAPSAVYLGE